MILWLHYVNGSNEKGPGFMFNPACMAYTTERARGTTYIHRLDGGIFAVFESESEIFGLIERNRLHEQNPLVGSNPA